MTTAAVPTWTKDALCTTVGQPEDWFGRQGKQHVLREAIQVCGGCPVAQQCLDLALQAEGSTSVFFRYGVYGGTTPAQRAEMAGARTRKAS